ncbi:MAG TPA: transaldolase, partial [candidate division WOR-3 bacterium]|nr:transaldolase [candidate division WOR-3 bacterium]
PAEEVIPELCRISRGPVFYQLTATDHEARKAEARKMHALGPERVVLKIPATSANMRLVAELSPGIPCAVTAIYAAHQGWVACEAGAGYLIPYLNRATRLQGDGLALVSALADIAEEAGTAAEVLVASIKTPTEAAQAVLAGARHLTMPLDIILALGDHPLSDAAIAEFNRAG